MVPVVRGLGIATLRTFFRFGWLGVIACGASSWLSGCQSSDASAGCNSAADCGQGAQCVNGQCSTASAGSAGGTHLAGGSAGSSSAAGSGNSSGSNASAGTGTGGNSFGGDSGVSGGASGGQSFAGSSGSLGSAGSGGQSSAGASGSAGSPGSAGMGPAPDVVGMCKEDYWPAANNGSVTRYDFKQGTSLPACANVITHTGSGSDGDWDTVEGISTGDGGYFGAMNTADYNKGAACGACVEITYNGNKKVLITIVDECPIGSNSLCVKGHIDLSRKAIRQLESNSQYEHLGNGGRGSISWHYVTCPASGNAKMRLHPKQNSDWQPVVVENGLYPLSKVTINGADAMRVGNTSGGNAWLASGQKLPYSVRATDINGDAIEASFDGSSGLKDIGKQFKCNK